MGVEITVPDATVIVQINGWDRLADQSVELRSDEPPSPEVHTVFVGGALDVNRQQPPQLQPNV